jgi:Zn finger protein HypA/HybF involved in hydrogenase expression
MENEKTNEVGLQCLQCGQTFSLAANEGGYCPDCRLADILLRDDRPAPVFQGQIGIKGSPKK